MPNPDAEHNLPFRILSGADEKVIRLFEAPYTFVKTYNSLNGQASKMEPLRYCRGMTNEQVENQLGG